MILVVSCAIFGLLLIFFEFFLPGAIMGISGGMLIIASIFLLIFLVKPGALLLTAYIVALIFAIFLIVKLAPAVTDISVMARAAVDAGVDALSLINTFTAMVIDIETRKPILANCTGGLSGPAIKPIAVYLVNKVYNEVTKDSNIPILGMGGIRTASDAIEFIFAGASAVGIGTANFIEPDCSVKIIEGIKKYCTQNKIENIKELIGSLE